MRRVLALFAGLFVAILTITGVDVRAQTTNATLSGTVSDPSGAAVAGAKVSVAHTSTGASTSTVTNDEGVYTFASLQPGTYKLSAEKTGFRRLVHEDVTLELSARIVLNVQMELGQINEEVVKVSAPLDPNLAIGTNSVGGVINGKRVQDLPLPNRDALGLVLTQAGLVGSNFAGGRIGQVNVQRDGINVQDMRINQGVNSTIFMSVDLVDEIRVVSSPADAEFGRGSGQVILATRAGGNEFHGSVFESHRNTVLNANTFFNNLIGAPRNELIRNQFGGRVGGPIIKNKTFFFVNYEGQRQRSLHDVGTAITHKGIICWKHYVEGKTQDQIARETHHSLSAVDNYLGKFDRVRHCLAQGLNPSEIAFTLNCSLGLVNQYILIDERIQQHHHKCKGKEQTSS